MKQATLLAIISISLRILIFIISYLFMIFNVESYSLFQILEFVDVLTYIGLLSFFVKLYKKQKNGI